MCSESKSKAQLSQSSKTTIFLVWKIYRQKEKKQAQDWSKVLELETNGNQSLYTLIIFFKIPYITKKVHSD